MAYQMAMKLTVTDGETRARACTRTADKPANFQLSLKQIDRKQTNKRNRKSHLFMGDWRRVNGSINCVSTEKSGVAVWCEVFFFLNGLHLEKKKRTEGQEG